MDRVKVKSQFIRVVTRIFLFTKVNICLRQTPKRLSTSATCNRFMCIVFCILIHAYFPYKNRNFPISLTIVIDLCLLLIHAKYLIEISCLTIMRYSIVRLVLINGISTDLTLWWRPKCYRRTNGHAVDGSVLVPINSTWHVFQSDKKCTFVDVNFNQFW